MLATGFLSGRRDVAPGRRVITVLTVLMWAQAFAWESAFGQTPASTVDEVNARLRPADHVIVTDTRQLAEFAAVVA